MEKKKYITLSIAIIMLSTAFCAAANAGVIISSGGSEIDSSKIEDQGTVEFYGKTRTLGDIYLIHGEKGTRYMGKFFDKYLPVNLPTEFKKDGIKVKFTAKVAVQDIIKLVILHIIDQSIPIYYHDY